MISRGWLVLSLLLAVGAVPAAPMGLTGLSDFAKGLSAKVGVGRPRGADELEEGELPPSIARPTKRPALTPSSSFQGKDVTASAPSRLLRAQAATPKAPQVVPLDSNIGSAARNSAKAIPRRSLKRSASEIAPSKNFNGLGPAAAKQRLDDAGSAAVNRPPKPVTPMQRSVTMGKAVPIWGSKKAAQRSLSLDRDKQGVTIKEAVKGPAVRDPKLLSKPPTTTKAKPIGGLSASTSRPSTRATTALEHSSSSSSSSGSAERPLPDKVRRAMALAKLKEKQRINKQRAELKDKQQRLRNNWAERRETLEGGGPQRAETKGPQASSPVKSRWQMIYGYDKEWAARRKVGDASVASSSLAPKLLSPAPSTSPAPGLASERAEGSHLSSSSATPSRHGARSPARHGESQSHLPSSPHSDPTSTKVLDSSIRSGGTVRQSTSTSHSSPSRELADDATSPQRHHHTPSASPEPFPSPPSRSSSMQGAGSHGMPSPLLSPSHSSGRFPVLFRPVAAEGSAVRSESQHSSPPREPLQLSTERPSHSVPTPSVSASSAKLGSHPASPALQASEARSSSHSPPHSPTVSTARSPSPSVLRSTADSPMLSTAHSPSSSSARPKGLEVDLNSPARPELDLNHGAGSPPRPSFDLNQRYGSPARPAFDLNLPLSSPSPERSFLDLNASPSRSRSPSPSPSANGGGGFDLNREWRYSASP